MLPWLMLLLGQDPLCERIASDRALVVARLIGAKAECDGCFEIVGDYRVEESFASRIPTGRLRVRITADNPRDGGGLYLIEVAKGEDNGLDYLTSSELIEGSPDDHPLIQRLRARLPATLPVEVMHDGKPLGEVRVMLRRSGADPMEAVSDATGVVRFADLRAGEYELRLSRERYQEEKKTIEVPAGSCSVARVELYAVNRFAGVLTDDSGNPLVNVELGLINEPETEDGAIAPRGVSMSDGEGRFHFENVPAGRYVLAVNGMGSASGLLVPKTFYPDQTTMAKAARFDVEAGGSIEDIRFVLQDLGRRYEVEVKGLGPDGKEELWHFLEFSGSRKGATEPVSKCCSAWPQVRSVEDADGRRRLVPQDPKRHRITMFEKMSYTIERQTIRRDSGCVESQPVLVEEGPKKNLELRFQKVPCQTGP